MGIRVEGLNELLGKLDDKLGKKQMQRISDEGLKRAADVFVRELKTNVRRFSRRGITKYSKGYTYDEITVSEPMWVDGKRTIKVYWQGPHRRYAIVHLNEWGTVRQPNPPGKGAIALSLKNSEKAYHEAIRQALMEGL